MPTPPPTREKVQSIVNAYIAARGPERTWTAVAKSMGILEGKNLKAFLEKWPPMYGIGVPLRRYESMSATERATVEIGLQGHKPVMAPVAQPQNKIRLETGGPEAALLNEYAAEQAAVDEEIGYDNPKGHFPVPPGFARGGDIPEFMTTHRNTIVFGVVSDTHLGSKYCRLDVLNDLYDRFEEAGIQNVLHAGNWIDGYKARINHHDLEDGCHTLHGQLRYLAKHYPQRKGITTWAVTGDDHEGWWARDHGLDIGDMALKEMEKQGRSDWRDIGYMESHIRIRNANSGESTVGSVLHPGGGTAYAISYHPQKYLESLEGGEKPAFAVIGHLHKMGKFNIRNVWTLLAGCTQDQTPFIRLRVRQEIHIGGMLVEFEQDPRTGALTGCGDKMLRYFVKSYYENGRWSKSGAVNLPRRAIGGA